MVKCDIVDCKKKAIFHMNCSLCNKVHCSLHRLPEEHKCINLEIKSRLNKSMNAQTLINGKTEAEKLENKI